MYDHKVFTAKYLQKCSVINAVVGRSQPSLQFLVISCVRYESPVEDMLFYSGAEAPWKNRTDKTDKT